MSEMIRTVMRPSIRPPIRPAIRGSIIRRKAQRWIYAMDEVEYVAMPYLVNDLSFTVEFSLRCDGPDNYALFGVDKIMGFFLRMGSGGLRLHLQKSGGGTVHTDMSTGSVNLNDGDWHRVSVQRRDMNNFTLILDGNHSFGSIIDCTPNSFEGPIQIGGTVGNPGSRLLKGSIKDFKLTSAGNNRVLAMDEGTGNKLYDTGGENKTCTIYNWQHSRWVLDDL